MIGSSLAAYLLAQSAITTLVSTRIDPLVLRQASAMPALVFTKISTSRPAHHGASGYGGYEVARFQIDCWATTYAGAKALGQKVRAALEGKQGVLSGAVSVNAILFVTEFDDLEPETQKFRLIQQYDIFHNEA